MNEVKTNTPEVIIYTDGACSPNPGPGGWGAVLLYEGQKSVELSGHGGETTNNRMELTAVLKALRALDKAHVITLYTDSQYVKNGITLWIDNWLRKDWKTSDKKPVKNVDLWKELITEKKRHQIIWKWVRGHDSNVWNERADQLAVEARKNSGHENEIVSKTDAGRKDCVHLYTGVTCKHSSGVGAWSLILCWRHHIKILGERVEGMTANQLYITAVIEGLAVLKKQLPVIVHTHSGYLRDGACSWLPGWKQRNWLTREGTPVSNRESWQKLSVLIENQEVSFELDDRDNPLCHMLEAKELAREFEQG